MKTKNGWNKSRLDLDRYLQIGDEVDDAMMYYFLEVLPPATFRANLIQIGEPCSHVQGRATFSTIYKPLGASHWLYAGHCHRGQWTEPVSPMTEQMKALKAIGDAIIETVALAGPLGAPGGHLYAVLMAHGMDIHQFEQIMAGLCQAGMLRKQGDCYFVAQKATQRVS